MDKKELPDIPELPGSFIDWIISKNFVLFVGAGVSALCGYPLWDKLANDLITYFRQEGRYDFQFENSIKNGNYSPIQKITILAQYLENESSLVIDKICESLVYDSKHCDLDRAKRIANYLFAFDSSIVTTNADIVFDANDEFNKYEKYNSAKSIKKGGLNRKAILHLHGCVKERDTLIFTESQYAENYIPSEKVGETLSKVIKGDKAILFIGYSLREFELLKYFIDPKVTKEKRRIFKLEGYFKAQEKTQLLLDEKYYEALGITLLPYFIDKKGYDALFDVLEKWTNEIKSQVSPSGDLHIDVADAISKKPNKATKQLVLNNINEIDPFFIEEKINTSKFCKEWIIALWNDSPLFDPIPYFSNNEASDFIVRSFWSGLLIIRNYIQKEVYNKSLEAKIKVLMKKTASLIKGNIKQKEKTKNSESIAIILSDIVMGRADLINEENIFNPIATFYIAEAQYGAYMLAEKIIEIKESLIKYVAPERLFSIVSLIATSEKKDKEHFEILKSPEIRDFILTNPVDYYVKSLDYLKKADWNYSVIGSFIHFPEEKNSILFEQQMYSSWLLIAIENVDNELVEKDIPPLLKSKKTISNKIGLCLLGIRLQENLNIFINNIKSFFNKYHYAADLMQLLKNNIDFVRDNDELKKALKENLEAGTFGCSDHFHQDIVRKSISSVLAEADNTMFESFILSPTENDFLNTLDSSASYYSIDTNKEVSTIYSNIKGKSLDDMINYVNGLTKGKSFYFDSSVYKAVDKYLSEKDYNVYRDKLKEIGETYLLRYICDDHFVTQNEEGAEKYLYLSEVLSEEEKKESMMSILFTCSKFIKSDNIDSKLKENIIKSIDYKLIEIKTIEEGELKIGTVINNPLHLYWSILFDYHDINEIFSSSILKESAFYFYCNFYNNRLLKGTMAAWFTFIYAYEKEKNEEYFDYVFNKGDSIDSFRIFAYINGNTHYYLKKLCSLDLFKEFILNISDDSQERIALAARIVLSYLFDGSYKETYVEIISNGDIEVIERVFFHIDKKPNDFLSESKLERFDTFVEGCIKSFEKYNKRSFSVNQILSYIVSLMTKEKDSRNPKIWKLLSLIPSRLSYYHGTSISDLLNFFSSTHQNECEVFLDSFFESYDYIYIYESYIVELVSIIKTIGGLKNNLKRWLKLIADNNPALYPKFFK